mgnify:FL=1
MLVSLCVPIHNKLHDLKQTMPYLVTAAQASPPVEIVVLDYGSTDGLFEYVSGLVIYHRYDSEYFHKAHAFNLAILASKGEYFVLLGADAFPHQDYIKVIRELISQGCIWMRANELCGIITCQREEFINAGGYDERFEFYGPEDRDLDLRLQRRGGKFGLVPNGLMSVIPTSNEDKVKNFRLKLSRREMSKLMRPIYEENSANYVLVANQGQAWGQWT